MKILFLTFYFEPDLCAGSFRNTPLALALEKRLNDGDEIHLITTMPNRYNSFRENALEFEKRDKLQIHRIPIPAHKSGFLDQINSFKTYFINTIRLTRKNHYDLVFASSSRLFTAFLGRYLAKKKKAPLYLDIRDIFTDTMNEVLAKSLIKFLTVPTLRRVEAYTFKNAQHINLVSKGFDEYFKKYDRPNYSYYTNGIDDEFLNLNRSHKKQNDQKIITYAGNIGEGQGLDKIIPQAAKKLGNDYKFVVIGDGGAKLKLVSKLEKLKVENVELIQPVNREVLKRHYDESDYLFLHLNNFSAFKKVLPSKIFEYGAYDKPIIAGVDGYASIFISENLDNYVLFEPGDVDTLVAKMKTFEPKYESRIDFRAKFGRSAIMDQMSTNIMAYLKCKNTNQ